MKRLIAVIMSAVMVLSPCLVLAEDTDMERHSPKAAALTGDIQQILITPVPTETEPPERQMSDQVSAPVKKTAVFDPDQPVEIGSRVTFGRYEQDNDPENGPEPIQWEILDIKDDKALLLSRFGLDVIPYNFSYTDTTWENCTLRRWLNTDFLHEAFSEKERSSIALSRLDNSTAHADNIYGTIGGYDTYDLVFALSSHEVYDVYNVNLSRVFDHFTRCFPTAYAKARGAGVSAVIEECAWWLRSPGKYQDCGAVVYTDGANGTNNFAEVSSDVTCVRPACWVSLNPVAENTSPLSTPIPANFLTVNFGLNVSSAVEYNGHRYCIFRNEDLSWEKAEAYCNIMGGHLAAITSMEENDFLYHYMTDMGFLSAFFGLTDSDTEGSWEWVTGESFDYANWHYGEPNNEYNDENYGMFYSGYSDGTWNDGNLTTTGNAEPVFICEWDYTWADVPSVHHSEEFFESIYDLTPDAYDVILNALPGKFSNYEQTVNVQGKWYFRFDGYENNIGEKTVYVLCDAFAADGFQNVMNNRRLILTQTEISRTVSSGDNSGEHYILVCSSQKSTDNLHTGLVSWNISKLLVTGSYSTFGIIYTAKIVSQLKTDYFLSERIHGTRTGHEILEYAHGALEEGGYCVNFTPVISIEITKVGKNCNYLSTSLVRGTGTVEHEINISDLMEIWGISESVISFLLTYRPNVRSTLAITRIADTVQKGDHVQFSGETHLLSNQYFTALKAIIESPFRLCETKDFFEVMFGLNTEISQEPPFPEILFSMSVK